MIIFLLVAGSILTFSHLLMMALLLTGFFRDAPVSGQTAMAIILSPFVLGGAALACYSVALWLGIHELVHPHAEPECEIIQIENPFI